MAQPEKPQAQQLAEVTVHEHQGMKIAFFKGNPFSNGRPSPAIVLSTMGVRVAERYPQAYEVWCLAMAEMGKAMVEQIIQPGQHEEVQSTFEVIKPKAP